MTRVWGALFLRELAMVAASRVIWIFAAGCLAFGIVTALGTPSEGSTGVWMILPLVLYVVPLLGILIGVVAARGDHDEEALIASRVGSLGLRLFVKWIVWSGLLGLAALAWMLPVSLRSESVGRVLSLWGYTLGESAVFVALGLALGRNVRDAVAAHLTALLLGFTFVAGAGVLGWLAARSPFFQEHPDLWTLGLMLHPVEALRVSWMFSLENLPFGQSHLPDLAAWWLAQSGLWYAVLVAVWSFGALACGRLLRSRQRLS